MIDTAEIIKAIAGLLKPVCANVYFGNAPVVFPKLDCDLRTLSDDDNRVVFRLAVDIFTDDGDFLAALGLSDRVREALSGVGGDCGGYLKIYADGPGFRVPDATNVKITHFADAFEVCYFKNE